MFKKRKPATSLLIMMLVMLALIGIRHGKLLLAPNSYFIDNTFDGFKCLAAAAYHIENDSTYMHYSGMI